MRHVKLILILSAVAGVGVVQHYEHERTRRRVDDLAAAVAAKPDAPATPQLAAPGELPRELNKVTSPAYVVEPPDVLAIEAVVRDPQTNKTVALPGQPVAGRFIVRPDGTVGLGQWGEVAVAGLTLEQAAAAVQKRLTETPAWKAQMPAGVPVVVVKMHACNSKWYYVIITRDGAGEQVARLPLTGNETVLDAVANVGGFPAKVVAGSASVQRALPTGRLQKLSIDWAAITERGVTATNYQLLAGDRVVVTLR